MDPPIEEPMDAPVLDNVLQGKLVTVIIHYYVLFAMNSLMYCIFQMCVHWDRELHQLVILTYYNEHWRAAHREFMEFTMNTTLNWNEVWSPPDGESLVANIYTTTGNSTLTYY